MQSQNLWRIASDNDFRPNSQDARHQKRRLDGDISNWLWRIQD
jgi:hypothetical protein